METMVNALLDSDPSLKIAAGTAFVVLKAYRDSYSPELRANAVCETMTETIKLQEQTTGVISRLSVDHQKEIEEAQNCKDQESALWINATRVKKLKTQLRKEGWIQRNLMPDYVCYSVEEDEFFRLSELEEEAYGYEQDVVATSIKAKQLKDQETAQLPRAGPVQQTRSPQFVYPPQSFDVDLESGLLDH